MKKEDIDKLKQSIEDGITVYEAIEKDLADGKLSLIEGAGLVLAHGGKAMRLISSIKEIGKEIVDLDSDETQELINLITDKFGGSEEEREAVGLIASGAGDLNQGIQKLISLRKK
jgi:hypothetical protein